MKINVIPAANPGQQPAGTEAGGATTLRTPSPGLASFPPFSTPEQAGTGAPRPSSRAAPRPFRSHFEETTHAARLFAFQCALRAMIEEYPR